MDRIQVLLAPNAFKGSLDSFEICNILSRELESRELRTISLPMGDGGDGTGRVLAHYLGALPVAVNTVDALGRKICSEYFVYGKTAIIELAASSGIKWLKKNEYNIRKTNTVGFGMMIADAVRAGCRNLLLCIGGSASVDGGLGALAGLLYEGTPSPGSNENPLLSLSFPELSLSLQRYRELDIRILCDVVNPPLGVAGAARVFGPQKGASEKEVEELEEAMEKLVRQLEKETGKSLSHLEYGGAAGGVALSFHALFNAELCSGADYCISLSGFRDYFPDIRVVVTGEGKIDFQSGYGKLPGKVAAYGKEKGCLVYGISGIKDQNNIPPFGEILSIMDYAPSFEEAFTHAPQYLRMMAHQLADSIYSHFLPE